MAMRLLTLEDVWYSYDGKRWVLRSATLSVSGGEVVAVVGPNGAGKTTLLKIMGLLYRPQRGRVLVKGVDAWASRTAALRLRRSVVYVHERPIMVRGTVLDNVALGLRLRGLDGAEVRRRVSAVARALGIEGLLDRDARKLSAGQAQLVALARALAVEPDVLLLDEPFANLDEEWREVVADVIRGYSREGRAVVVVSHDRSVLARVATRWVRVRDGRVEAP